MDANQTRFHLVLGQSDWARCTDNTGRPILDVTPGVDSQFTWDDRNLLTLGVRLNIFKSSPVETAPVLDDRRGAAQDRFGNWYSISASRTEIVVNSSGTSATTHFWSSTDEAPQPHAAALGRFGDCPPAALPALLAFSGLTVTTEHFLVAGVIEPKGIVVFDLFHGGPPRQFIWPTAIPFEPFDMAAAPDGGVWILDRANGRVWALDRTFAVIATDQQQQSIGPNPSVFAPADGSLPTEIHSHLFPQGLSLDLSSPLDGINAIAIEALPDGTFLVLESDAWRQFSRIFRFRFGTQVGDPVSTAVILSKVPSADQPAFELLGHDFVFLSSDQSPLGTRTDILYIAGSNGDQAWAFTLGLNGDQLTLDPLAEYYPMRQFGGKGIVAGGTQPYYDFQDRWIPLVMQKRPRYVGEAALTTKIFDGKEPDCVWHRLMLDASIPSDAAIEVQSRSHNDPNLLAAQAFQDEPAPYKRRNGTELPWTNAGVDTYELLFQRATGRYIQLRLILSGSGRSTPKIRALRAYYPRFSYLSHYVPSVYREDTASASFLDRFLANTEGFFTSIEDRIATVQALFDVASAPPDTLAWLANWFGVALDPAWTEPKQRLFLRNAMQFFEARGTLPGLIMALRLTLENCADQGIFTAQSNPLTSVRIVEGFRNRSLPIGMLQDSAAASGLPVQLQTNLWTPSQGGDELNRRYREALQLPATALYPLSLQTSDPNYSGWQAFSRTTLGFVPSISPDPALWKAFLVTRYFTITALNAAYLMNFSNFDDVALPLTTPQQPQALTDWYRFQGVVLMQSSAHQFTVYLPQPVTGTSDASTRLAKRVIDLEKPAHTTYDIQFYWAFFRVGDARLGQDSVLDSGSRAPQLLGPAVLGSTYVGSTYLSRELPGSARSRAFLQPDSTQQCAKGDRT